MKEYYLISDAAKEVEVESHVLRYWEEELKLPIRRNDLGHRYYTREDVERFRRIKGLKDRGLQLKAIRMILKDGKLDLWDGMSSSSMTGGRTQQNVEKTVPETPSVDMTPAVEGDAVDKSEEPHMNIEIIESRDAAGENQLPQDSAAEDRSRRLQWMLRQMMREAVQENNQELCREIRESVIKELDYQFRMQEEREEEREKASVERTEAYYRRMDELLRERSSKKRKGLFDRYRKQKAEEGQNSKNSPAVKQSRRNRAAVEGKAEKGEKEPAVGQETKNASVVEHSGEKEPVAGQEMKNASAMVPGGENSHGVEKNVENSAPECSGKEQAVEERQDVKGVAEEQNRNSESDNGKSGGQKEKTQGIREQSVQEMVIREAEIREPVMNEVATEDQEDQAVQGKKKSQEGQEKEWEYEPLAAAETPQYGNIRILVPVDGGKKRRSRKKMNGKKRGMAKKKRHFIF